MSNAECNGRYGILFPELDDNYLVESINKLLEHDVSFFNIELEDANLLKNEIVPYWVGKTFWEDITAIMPEETRRITYDSESMFDSLLLPHISG